MTATPITGANHCALAQLGVREVDPHSSGTVAEHEAAQRLRCHRDHGGSGRGGPLAGAR